ncbi:MAG TPA: 1-acyl-sn-glycerol-3-phosphate acyltransferase [Leptospiraceae bacterium]|nr:1-acyl-sn-glycerol-3-phosphate acyltransferase [Leptospiraceae bacterium]HMX35278.1 1-acyl-sn-glycerol-3-phosphate acyltransferase [Leptospiraceae bacterium]HMY34330.1 1-acyl-sn-glycerol-3-phosphate acyltransferase [Leptospiraceae bacterium]HMZ66749.1 1-acyl-sn-glycerol-3-phosphate acyltransferase [Leptospiraceae bacterium]HNC01111.1 1-acyl-sn-glycerol-3-phosphate acyltransferase [Leptospiraceae bacterium]
MKTFFIPPEFNIAVAWISDALNPFTLKTTQNIQEVVIKPEDKERILKLRNDRLLFFSNHPSQAEPMIAYYIANVMATRFHYMATRRAFDFMNGMVGKWFQGTGTFSVMPGVADKESMKMTRYVLSQPSGKLVIFPEGEPMCSENDNLMPFQSGIIKLGFSALADARETEPDADITILPAFIKYVITTPKEQVAKNIEGHISKIESKLGANAGGRNLLRRFLMVGRILQEKAEKEYGIEVTNEDYNFRIGKIRHTILDRLAQKMKLKHYDQNADAIQKLRLITTTLELIEVNYPSPDLPKLSQKELDYINNECIKAYDFIVMKPDYLISYPTPERFYEWLQRFESLVLGATPRMLGGEPHHEPRKAHVFFGKTFHFGDYSESYKKNKAETVTKFLTDLRKEMQSMLDESQKLTSPIVEPGDIGGT